VSVADDAKPERGWFAVGGDEVRLLRDGGEAFPAMLDAIAAARDEILLEMYWIGVDAVGSRFVRALGDKAREGVAVKVIYDALGSIGVQPEFFQPITSAGGRVHEYHPLLPIRPSFSLANVQQRDHRKVLVVDRTVGFTGGLNLATEWAPVSEGGLGWRDDVVEVRGVAALELRTLFYKTWRRLAWELSPPDLLPLRRSRGRPVYVLATQRRSKRSIHAEYVSRINAARRTIDISNPYFVPDRAVQKALARACLRGVRVRVLLPARGDVPIVQFAQEGLYDRLLAHGVELYQMPGPMMHAKTAIIDEHFVTIGSYNLDERSFRVNLEVNIAIEDTPFARHVRDWFDADCARSKRVDLAAWRDRSLMRRGVERVALALRRFW
jgi:cardiolipin synthase